MSHNKFFKKTKYRYCFVPGCTSTHRSKDKIFMYVPRQYKKKWLEAVGIGHKSLKSIYSCCLDHFDLEKDAINWHRFKKYGGLLKIRDDVVPHKFIPKLPLEPPSQNGVGGTVADARERKLKNFAPIGPNNHLNLSDLASSDKNLSNPPTLKPSCYTAKCRFMVNDIQKNPHIYLGIDKSEYFMVDLIARHSIITQKEVFLILRKIRLDEPFAMLGNLFDMSTLQSFRTFFTYVSKVSNALQEIIEAQHYDDHKVQRDLLSYGKIDCFLSYFKVKIESPKERVKLAKHWSKHCGENLVVNYLISWTPDCFINYVSDGYVSDISDSMIMENSNFLSTLDESTIVMTENKFQDCEPLLVEKNIKLIDLDTVESTEDPNKKAEHKNEVTALRFKFKRMLENVRKFKILSELNVLNHKFSTVVDEIVLIACALSNIQVFIPNKWKLLLKPDLPEVPDYLAIYRQQPDGNRFNGSGDSGEGITRDTMKLYTDFNSLKINWKKTQRQTPKTVSARAKGKTL